MFSEADVYVVICWSGLVNNAEVADCELAQENNSFASCRDVDPEIVS